MAKTLPTDSDAMHGLRVLTEGRELKKEFFIKWQLVVVIFRGHFVLMYLNLQ